MQHAKKVAGAIATVAGLVILTPAAAPAAAGPPRTGTVSCGESGAAIVHRKLQFSTGPRPDPDSRLTFKTPAVGCTGSQTGGNPHHPGPIDHASVIINGQATGHTCSGLSADGLHTVKMKITWYDGAGASLGVTKVALGTGTVTGLGNGVPSDFPPPNNPPPGIITFTLTGTADASSSAFPGAMLHATFVADRTVESFPVPCSLFGPKLKPGINRFDFSGVNGPSTIAVA